ncbi:MAG: class I SAM-dependent methyltransferase [Anaerolineaceae bacterium]|nr:class I SAM-dependent methyltransferase [Anaerolineaceae bacterium]
MDDVVEYNSAAWNRLVEDGNPWTIPVTSQAVADARAGKWEIILTPIIPVPKSWFPELKDCDALCLASGGGQQGPILAAAGANVTVFDNSPRQLERDRFVAERDGLTIHTVQGDMRDLSVFSDECFDLIVHPVSNCFAPEVRPVWREAFRVLRSGGSLLSGFNNPAIYLFDYERYDQGFLEVKNPLPYSDIESFSEQERQEYIQKGDPFEFSHSLDDQIGGQIDAGFLIAGFYEDCAPGELMEKYMPSFMVTRALKP